MNLIHHGNITALTEGLAIHSSLPVQTYDVQVNGRTGEFELHHHPEPQPETREVKHGWLRRFLIWLDS
jgi:hypothetical protein